MRLVQKLIKLKKCKNAFIVFTAEYIKNIQAILSQKIAKIDKLIQFYMNFLDKPDFEREDSAEIDKILSTRLELKQLEHFNEFGFKDYLKQDIIELKQLALLSNEGTFLVDILRLCKPKNIPERMLRTIMVNSHKENCWFKAKEELIQLQLVIIDENSKFWTIYQSRMKGLRD